MAKPTVDEIYQLLIDFINRTNPDYTKWYVGIASNPKNRLFKEHNVSEDKGKWVFIDAGSLNNAKEVVNRIVKEYNLVGSIGITNESIAFVYVYLKENSTIEIIF